MNNNRFRESNFFLTNRVKSSWNFQINYFMSVSVDRTNEVTRVEFKPFC